MIVIGFAMIGVATIWFLYKLYISYTSAGGTDFAMPVFDAALYPPILCAVGLYLVLKAYEVTWSVWIYVGIWFGSTVLAVAIIKLAEHLGDREI